MSERALPIDPDPLPAAERVDPSLVAAVAGGGVVGAVARHALTELWPVEPGSFPWATFAANTTGSLVLGLALVVLLDVWPTSERTRALVSTGVLGAFTTMSTFVVEAAVLGRDGHLGLAVGYVFATMLVGLGAAGAGIGLGRLAATSRGQESAP